MLSIKPVNAFNDNYIWLIIHTSTQQCCIVDPGMAEPVSSAISQLKLKPAAILITHHHFDHTQGVAALVQEFSIPVFGPEDVPTVTHPLQAGDNVAIASFPIFQVLAIPGHTQDHLAYYGHGLLFAGDTLFTAGCGRVFEGTFAQMYQSLAKLAALPKDTLLYCGHEYTLNNLRFAKAVEPNNPTILARIQSANALRQQALPTVPSTLELELATNPFLRCHQPSVIEAANQYAKQTHTDAVEIFRILRQWKDKFT